MAVVLGAIVGVGALIVYDNVNSYSDYSDYDDYSDYSDAEERKKRRIRTMKDDVLGDVNTLSNYKTDSINPELVSNDLKNQTALRVSVSAMDEDVKQKNSDETNKKIVDETDELRKELNEIEGLIGKIDKMEKESD